MKTILTRTLSGLIYIVLIIGSILIGPVTFGSVFFVFLIIGLLEIYDISKISGHYPQRNIFLMIGLAVYLLNVLVIWEYLPIKYLVLNLGLILLPFLIELFRKVKDPVQNLGFYLIGLFYLVIPIAVLNVLFFPDLDLKSPSNNLLIGFFLLTWVYDTFAYLSGMLWGKHKFFKRISPKKTWEGTIGGAVFAILGAYALSQFFTDYTKYEWIGLGLMIIIFGTFGDLIESMIKRTYGLKDSGKIMPGHGGILDRLDSILIASPFVLLYVVLILN